jgi:hypothetical protein
MSWQPGQWRVGRAGRSHGIETVFGDPQVTIDPDAGKWLSRISRLNPPAGQGGGTEIAQIDAIRNRGRLTTGQNDNRSGHNNLLSAHGRSCGQTTTDRVVAMERLLPI